MQVKIPKVRRTDSLYAKIGGKESLQLIIGQFLERVFADAELDGSFADVDSDVLNSEMVHCLLSVLGGPVGHTSNSQQSLFKYVSHDATTYPQLERHFAAALQVLRVPRNLAGEVLALLTPVPAEQTDSNPAAPPQKGKKAMSKNHRSSAAVLEPPVLTTKHPTWIRSPIMPRKSPQSIERRRLSNTT